MIRCQPPQTVDSKTKKHFANSSWNTRMGNGKPNLPPDPLPIQNLTTMTIRWEMPSHSNSHMATRVSGETRPLQNSTKDPSENELTYSENCFGTGSLVFTILSSIWSSKIWSWKIQFSSRHRCTAMSKVRKLLQWVRNMGPCHRINSKKQFKTPDKTVQFNIRILQNTSFYDQ